MQTRRILVAPLDWGLGHASRCVPLIRRFLQEGHTVTLAGTGASGDLLRLHFPALRFLELPGYAIRYPSHSGLVPYLGLQIPGLLRSIRKEHDWLEQLLKQESFDQIISDNRYGLWHPAIASVILTHQLYLPLPTSMRWAKGLVQRRLHRWLNRFGEIWVPDHPGRENLSGGLSHPAPGNLRVEYIGPLSRFSTVSLQQVQQKTLDVVAVLSGPEPQRSLLESRIVASYQHTTMKVRIITGQPGVDRTRDSSGNIEFVGHLADEEFIDTMKRAGTIYCRSGYSSLMDLDALGLKAVLIPTPGQTEQEYLAEHFRMKGWEVLSQSELSK